LRANAGEYGAEVDAALLFSRRVGVEQIDQWVEACRWLTGVLRGETPAALVEGVPIDRYADNPTARVSHHLTRAVAAAILHHPAALAHHTAALMQCLILFPVTTRPHWAACCAGW
jgi:hypothetical protein